MEFTKSEDRLFRRLTRPELIQRFLDEEVRYDGKTHCYSPRKLMALRRGHCMEGSLFAAAALRRLGYPPLILDLEAVNDDDHVIALFRRQNLWGAVAKSNYSGLRYREPVYRTLRELVMSYFEHYYNLKGERTLRGYAARPVNLTRFDKQGWMTADEDPWYIAEHLVNIRHTPILPPRVIKQLTPLDKRLQLAGKLGRQ